MARRVWTLAKLLLHVVKWFALFAIASTLPEVGRRTPFGPGILLFVAPTLAVEAWLSAPAHFRTRLFHTLGFAIPAVMWRLFAWLVDTTCNTGVGNYHESPSAKGFAILEAVAQFFHFTAVASLPSLVLLVLAFRTNAPGRERTAYLATTTSALVATVNIAVLCSFVWGAVWVQLPL